MLERSFVFLPGIGPVREARLWRHGIADWAAYRALPRVPGIRPHLKARHDEVLSLAATRVGRDARFFAKLLPSAEHWRAYDAFHRDAAYIDIETTGDRENAVTVVGVRFRSQNRAFVLPRRGFEPAESEGAIHDAGGVVYTPEAVAEFLQGATMMVTFNGASFDLPVMANDGVKLPDAPHVDLRLVFNRLGYAGGLKKIEDRLGMGRGGELAGLTGWDAVKLWRKWEKRGDADALRTLVHYNIADFQNLEPLARFACEKLCTQTLNATDEQVRLETGEEGAPPAGP